MRVAVERDNTVAFLLQILAKCVPACEQTKFDDLAIHAYLLQQLNVTQCNFLAEKLRLKLCRRVPLVPAVS